MPMVYRLASDVPDAWQEFCQHQCLSSEGSVDGQPPPPSAFLSFFKHLQDGGATAQQLRDKYQLINTTMWDTYGVCLGQWPQIAFFVYYGYAYDENLPAKVFDIEEINQFCDSVDLEDTAMLTKAAIVVSCLCGAPGDGDQLFQIDYKGNQ